MRDIAVPGKGEADGKKRPSAWEGVFSLARRIPRGRVMTYGQIADLIEERLSPRAVGWALHRCPEDVPWQRVVNAAGACSTDQIPDLPTGLQRALLEGEGIEFRANGTVDLDRYRWKPRRRSAASRKKLAPASRPASRRKRSVSRDG